MDLVIQGPYTDYTDKIIYSYLNLPFVRNIIVSCWESDKKSNIFDSRVRFVRSPAYDGWPGSANVNLQLTTCLAGVQASDAPWVGKMRSDQLFNEDGLINMYEFFVEHRKDDTIFVTGNIGDAYAGLKILNKNIKSTKSLENYFIKKYYIPDIAFKIYKYLPSIASSSIDISDGLILDLERMINNQNLGYILSIKDIPISKNLQKLIQLNNFQKKNFVSNGDDYQVLFTSSLKKVEQIKKLSKRINIKITKIGTITNKPNQIINTNGNYLKSIKNKGYLHKFK